MQPVIIAFIPDFIFANTNSLLPSSFDSSISKKPVASETKETEKEVRSKETWFACAFAGYALHISRNL